MTDPGFLLVCGSRKWSDEERIRKCLTIAYHEDGYRRLVHGGAPGADEIAGRIGREIGFAVTVEHARWQELGDHAGPIRNAAMLHKFTPRLVLAFPLGESRGTKNMISLAVKCGIQVIATT